MINLLPKQEKDRLKSSFYLHFVTVFFFSIGICVFIACVLLIPSYLFAITQKKEVNQKLLFQKNSPAPQNEEGNSLVIRELNNKLTLIEKSSKEKFLVSANIINQIILEKMQDIKILNITYNSDSFGKKITINGNAPSRERLLLFRIALENNVAFSKVDLPISNFVKGSNIQFSLNLIPR